MYKRQYYAVEHADNGEPSSSDSSSLNTDSDGSGEEQDDASWPASEHESGSSGEEGVDEGEEESGSDNAEALESESEDEEWSAYRSSKGKDVKSFNTSQFLSNKPTEAVEDTEKEKIEETIGDSMVLQIGGILKCRLCVKIMCLSEETMRAHLVSKRHARSLKQLANGKLKVQLNSDGEEDEEAETHTERLARIRSIAEEKVEPVKRKRDSGRQRQRKRTKKKALSAAKRRTCT